MEQMATIPNFRVLVVDDEEVMRSLFIDLLTDKGYEVTAVCNGKEALEKIALEKFDAVFMDVHMPVMNGIDTLKEMKKANPLLNVVMMDSFPNHLVASAQKEGAVTCIHKPFNINQVYTLLEEFRSSKVQ